MSLDMMRPRFEAWVLEEGLRQGYDALQASVLTERSSKGGYYCTVWVEGAWKGWQAAQAAPAGGAVRDPKGPEAFKAFHMSLSKRFGYCHDEWDWWRDLVSVEEHIAGVLDVRLAALRECRKALDSLLADKPMLAAKVCRSTTLGNLRASLGADLLAGVPAKAIGSEMN